MWLQSIIGISVVVLALVVLSFSIFVFGKIMTKDFKKETKKSKTVEEKSIIVEVDGDDELIAVITAAVQAYFGTVNITPECKIRVKSFNRVESNSPTWNKTSNQELVNNIEV